MVWDKKKWMKEYRKKNREKINEYYRRYYLKNKKKHIILVQKWKKDNPEKMAAYNKRMMKPELREKRRIYLQEWRDKNRDNLRAYHKKWKENNGKKSSL